MLYEGVGLGVEPELLQVEERFDRVSPGPPVLVLLEEGVRARDPMEGDHGVARGCHTNQGWIEPA